MISFYILVIIGAILLWILLANIGTFKFIGWISSALGKGAKDAMEDKEDDEDEKEDKDE